MVRTIRPRRSVLYMPGSNPRAMAKGRTLPADGLILDLEDAVAPDAKVEARARVVETVREGGFGHREIFIRINGLGTPWGYEDLVAVANSGADGVLLPKVASADTVRQAETILVASGAPESLAIWCMIETPMGVLNAKEIAAASARLVGFVMGTSDLAKDLRAAHTRERLPLITGLGWCLMVARAFGLAILDGVHLDLNDDEGFAYSCERGAELGFDGKTLVHPKTIALANTTFAHSVEEIAFAHRIIEAHALAIAEKKGLVVLDGRLIENLHVEQARHLVALDKAIKAMAAS
ncbi:(3S)-malyl-CoA thioesterase [uncultured Gammaproteobacteria bacterium]